MRFSALLRLGILAIALHNLEEALTMPAWIETRLPALLQRLGVSVEAPSWDRLATGLVIVTVVPAIVLALGSRAGAHRGWVYASLLIVAILLWNALLPHLAATFVVGGYTPGVITAVLVNIPYATITFRRATDEGVATARQVIAIGVMAALLYPLGMLLLWSPSGSRCGASPTPGLVMQGAP